ncbi:MAG: hypothetical protein KAS32_08925 [Candidatus Peribacteraceae bacterium]|nr:hypothetical protein [Candidatus Peribacteraceae bacterium]
MQTKISWTYTQNDIEDCLLEIDSQEDIESVTAELSKISPSRLYFLLSKSRKELEARIETNTILDLSPEYLIIYLSDRRLLFPISYAENNTASLGLPITAPLST